jgi:GMP synthase-like glutamine amidotransferase
MNRLRIHYIQHVSFEGIGYIEQWAKKSNHILSSTKLYNGESLPDNNEFDWLIIMGGPMGIYQEQDYPWLANEKSFIKDCIDAGKKVIGICLGAQLIADVLECRVYANPKSEIGWFPVSVTDDAKQHDLLKGIPDEIMVMHWHGDTFDLPEKATLLLKSTVCKNQAFIYNNHILGLQFHLESTPETLKDIVNNCREELVEGEFIQSEDEIFNNSHKCSDTNIVLDKILTQFYHLKQIKQA